jgi:hypothetical protein
METFSSADTSANLETHSQIKTPDDTKIEIVEMQEKISSLREQRKKTPNDESIGKQIFELYNQIARLNDRLDDVYN